MGGQEGYGWAHELGHDQAGGGAPARGAEPPHLWAHRCGPGRGRLPVLAGYPAAWRMAAVARARDLHQRRRHRYSRRLLCTQVGGTHDLRTHARSDRRQALGRVLSVHACLRRYDSRSACLGRDRDPLPRDPGLGPARVPRRTAGERAGDKARQMEDDLAARRRRLPARGRCRRRDRAGGDPDRPVAALALGPADAVHWLGLFPRRAASSDRGVSVKLLYFAWVRERVGKPEEDIEPPTEIATVADLMTWLSRRGEEYAHAFENPKVIRAAIDRTHVRGDAAIFGAREIAFFPPMTGGWPAYGRDASAGSESHAWPPPSVCNASRSTPRPRRAS